MQSQTTTKRDDLNTPDVMTETEQRIHATISKVLRDHGATYTGGCTTFYTPGEWRARDEKYGLQSELIVVYDGGDVRDAFEPYGPDQSLNVAMVDALRAIGFYYEPCTCWYSAIYPLW